MSERELALVSEDADPSGLGGQRYVYNAKAAPYIVQTYAYPTTISFETIREAWLKVLPRAKHMTGFRTEGVRGGKRLITIDSYQPAPEPKRHIDEAPV